MKSISAYVFSLLAVVAVQFAYAQESVELTSDGGGEKTCLQCHNTNTVNAILGTPHFVAGDPRSPAANEACEACHGPSKEHTQFPQRISNISFAEDSSTDAFLRNAQCLNCHQGDHVDWDSSTHANQDMSCASCHEIHAHRDAVLNPITQTDVCVTCHLQQKMQINKPYRHPVREGIVPCTRCHNPHGSSGPTMLVKQSVNETCYLCHAEKRGPFVNEHEPVQDDCTNCHTPHGSNHENLLSVRPPFLCQQCHSDHSHPREAYDFEDLPGGSGRRQSRVVGGACVNCHSQIHGSNSPGARSMRQ